jgi:hypothetical protein
MRSKVVGKEARIQTLQEMRLFNVVDEMNGNVSLAPFISLDISLWL